MNPDEKKLLLMKTGTTIPCWLDLGEDFEDWIVRESGAEIEGFVTSAVHLEEKLPATENVAGVIITGSPAYLTDLDSWNQVAADYIRECYLRQIPVLGICYGHQLIAWAFGGEVEFHKYGREIGTVNIRATEASKIDPLFKALPTNFMAHVSHEQSVVTLPDEAVLLAENDFEPHHGFRIGKCLWGIQFHPEFTCEITRSYIKERREVIESEGLDAEKILNGLTATPEATSLLSVFVELAMQK
jgi:GMP synthase (glutamine-hydrolysing)